MLLLVVDTSTPAVTAALVDVTAGAPPAIVAEQVTVDARRHGELLTPAVEAVMAEAGVPWSALGAVVAGVGPGPYTGLRVGLVSALALGDTLGLPTYGVCSLDGLSHPRVAGQRVLVATDARRREVYWAVYDADGTRLSGPAVDRPTEVDTTGCDVARGAGARLYADVLGLPLQQPDYPQVLALARPAAARALGNAPAEPLTPMYLRRPDATPPGIPKTVLT